MIETASRCKTRSRQALGLAAGLLFLGTLIVGNGPASFAQDPPKKAAVQPAGSDVPEVVQLINTKLAEGWKAAKITPSARATDFEFIRRVSLDLIGRIAKPEEIARFLKDPAGTRRSLLIDRLLASDEYAKNWANVWTVWLMTRSGSVENGTRTYHEQMHLWLEERFKDNQSFKEMVAELLTASGKTNENGAVNFILSHLGEPVPPANQMDEGRFEMVPITSRTTRLFLGLQTQCTQCHDHPFNPEWKQQHFWGINTFFRQVERGGAMAKKQKAMVTPVLELRDNPTLNPKGIIYYEKRASPVVATKASFIDGKRPALGENGPTRRQELARFITDSEYFPRSYVNRMWGHFLGRGFAHPVDDFGDHNPTAYPELLDELAKKFVHYGYDTKRLIRWICNSEPYHLSCQANKTNDQADHEKHFSRMLLKAMTPEQLFDSLVTATQAEVAESRDARRKLRQDWMSKLIVNFGDDEGNEATFNGTVVQALLMMNGDDINRAITYNRGTLAQAVARRGNVLNDLYLAALNRPPTPNETTRIRSILATAPSKNRDPMGPYQDLFWALLNSNEFILNH